VAKPAVEKPVIQENPGRIAVVDDEKHIRETVSYALHRDGHRVDPYPDGQAAWDAMQGSLPDLAVVDILMPRIDGLELCRRLRARSEQLPILFLSSRDEEFDRVLGLEIGADDYLCKPFSMRELLARVKVLLRRQRLASEPPLAAALVERGMLSLDTERYVACWGGDEVLLTVTEFLIVGALAERPGHVRTRDQLVSAGYPHDTFVSDRTIDSHIKRIRRKFRDHGGAFIETVHGLGYRFRSYEEAA
jgi:DNA-binding response OmpR family regulator